MVHPRVVLAFEPFAEGGGETRFADAGLAANQNDLAFARGGAAPAAQ
jgi:hypothetical protein